MDPLEELLAKPPETRTATICLDQQIAERYSEARRKADVARATSERRLDDPEAAARAEEAAAELSALEDQVRAKLVTFTFAAVDPDTWDRLKAEHRPTEAQRTEARKNGQPPPEWNSDTFYPTLMAAACVGVKSAAGERTGMSPEDAHRVWKSPAVNSADRAELGNAAAAAYLTRTRVELDPKAD